MTAVAMRDRAIHVSGVLTVPDGEGTCAEQRAAGLRSARRCIEPILGTTGATRDDATRINSDHDDLARQLEVAACVRRGLGPAPHTAWTAGGMAALAAPDGGTDLEVTADRSRQQHLSRGAMHTPLEQRRWS